jgi:hypothetical protein
VTIVQRIEPKILNMPTKRWKEHAHVDPRDGDSTDLFVVLVAHFEYRSGRFINVVEVEKGVGIIEVGVGSFGIRKSRETRAILMGGQISSVLHSKFGLVRIGMEWGGFPVNDVPILVLKLGLESGSEPAVLELVVFFEVLGEVGEGVDIVRLLFFLERLHYI